MRLDRDQVTADPDDGDAGHATRTYIRGSPVPSPIDLSILGADCDCTLTRVLSWKR